MIGILCEEESGRLSRRRKGSCSESARGIAEQDSERITLKKKWLKDSRYKQNHSRYFGDLKEANKILYEFVNEKEILV